MEENCPSATGLTGTQAIIFDNAVFIAAGSRNRGGKPELSTIERSETEN